MSRPNETIRAEINFRDLPKTSKTERFDLALWLENLANTLRHDDPKTYDDKYTARYIIRN